MTQHRNLGKIVNHVLSLYQESSQ